MNFEQASLLTATFGKWPDFHDAEVLRVTLDRSGIDGPTMDLVIRVFEMTREVDPAGFYELKHDTQVTLRFTNVSIESLGGINRQNVLEELVATPLDPAANEDRAWRIELVPSYGLGAVFECGRAIVAQVSPFGSQPDMRLPR